MNKNVQDAVKNLQKVFQEEIGETENSAVVITVLSPDDKGEKEILHAGAGDVNAMLNMQVASFEDITNRVTDMHGADRAQTIAASVLAKMVMSIRRPCEGRKADKH